MLQGDNAGGVCVVGGGGGGDALILSKELQKIM